MTKFKIILNKSGGDGSIAGSSSSRGGKVKLRKRKMFTGTGTGVELEDISLESDYKGPHVKLPMTVQNLQELIDGFKSKKVSCFVIL